LTGLVRWAVWAAIALLFVGSLGQVLVQSLRLGGLAKLPAVLLDTRVGVLALARLVPALAAVWVTLQLPRPEGGRGADARWLNLALPVVFGLLGGLFVWAAIRGGYWVTLAWVATICALGLELAWSKRP